ncbi:MAG: glycosyltransferase family 2 protein, partial [Pseudomonadota bacterium]
YADQFQWGVDNMSSESEWIMRLDADEIIEPDLADRIAKELPALGSDTVGVNIDRKHIFMGRWIRHGGRYPLTLLRIFRRGHGRIEQRWMDEHIMVEGGKTVHFKGGFADHNLNDLTFFIEKHNHYATREALDALSEKYELPGFESTFTATNVPKQAGIKRWIKEKVYNRIPFPISTFGYFIYRYIFQLGFLDRREGLIYHFLQGYWYRFLVGAKVQELETIIRSASNQDEMIDLLEAATGRKIRP